MKAQKREEFVKASKDFTVVGLFEDRSQADRAVADLLSAGFRDDQIGVAMRHNSDAFELGDDSNDGSEAGAGAASGALAGLGVGALAGMGVLAGVIPVIGPAIAGGTLGVILSNAAAGAGIAGLIGALVGAGIPEHEATYYQDEFEAGRVVVTVQAATRAKEAQAILGRYGAYDARTRENRGATMSAMSMNMQAATPGFDADNDDDTVETKTLEIPVEREDVASERKPIRRNSDKDNLPERGEIRIPVQEQEVDITKSPVLIDEIKAGKRPVRDTGRASVQSRKQQLESNIEGDVDTPSLERAKGKKTT